MSKELKIKKQLKLSNKWNKVAEKCESESWSYFIVYSFITQQFYLFHFSQTIHKDICKYINWWILNIILLWALIMFMWWKTKNLHLLKKTWRKAALIKNVCVCVCVWWSSCWPLQRCDWPQQQQRLALFMSVFASHISHN